MGLNRGPLRNPESVRGRKERAIAPFVSVEPERPAPPAILNTEMEREMFESLVADCIAANVPVKKADALAFAMTVKTVTIMSDPKTPPLRASRLSEAAMKWIDLIGASPKSRARLGIREKPKETSKLARLIRTV